MDVRHAGHAGLAVQDRPAHPVIALALAHSRGILRSATENESNRLQLRLQREECDDRLSVMDSNERQV